ncbi:MAG: hypothetical protein ACTTJI_00160 [Capnocytophaga sp.]|uniref:hypothetical protein n=1 Tax=Capnocytophaga sp. TaxID=44737 RepID=UPI003F9FD327
MLSEHFENTKTITFVIVLLALLMGSGLYQYQILGLSFTEKYQIITTVITFFLLWLSLLLLHQIDRWNELTETKNSYSIAFFSIFVVLFPTLFLKNEIVGANLLIMAAMWRALTLKTGIGIPQKLFDTSLLILCAALLHPWAIIFLLNIWISLLFYGAQKRRYWFIPFLALLVIALLAASIVLLLDIPFPFDYYTLTFVEDVQYLFQLSDHSLPYLVALGCFVVLFAFSLIVYYFRSKYHSISSLVVIQFLWVGLLVVLLSKEMIYLFAPIAVLFALYVEKITLRWLKETLLWLLLVLPALVLSLHFIAKG